MRVAKYPCRKKATEGKEDNAPITYWLNRPQLRLSALPHSKLFPPLLPGTWYNRPPTGTEQKCPFSPWIFSDNYLMEDGSENLMLPVSKAPLPREGQWCPAGRTLGFGWSISVGSDPECAGKKQRELPQRVCLEWAEL